MTDIVAFLTDMATKPRELARFWSQPKALLDEYGFTLSEQKEILGCDGTTLDAGGWNAHDELSEPVAERAMELYDDGRHEDALRYLDEAIEADPRVGRGVPIEKGLVLMALARYEEALDCFKMAGEASLDLTVYYNMAVAAVRARGVGEARSEMEDLRRALVRHILTSPFVAKGLYGLAGLYALEGTTEQAAKYLRQAILFEDEIREWAQADHGWAPYWKSNWFTEIVT